MLTHTPHQSWRDSAALGRRASETPAETAARNRVFDAPRNVVAKSAPGLDENDEVVKVVRQIERLTKCQILATPAPQPAKREVVEKAIAPAPPEKSKNPNDVFGDVLFCPRGVNL